MTDLLRRWAVIVRRRRSWRSWDCSWLRIRWSTRPVPPGGRIPTPMSVCPVAEAGGGFSSRLGVSASDGGHDQCDRRRIAGRSRSPDGGGAFFTEVGELAELGTTPILVETSGPAATYQPGRGPLLRSPGASRRQRGRWRSWGCRPRKVTAPRWSWSTLSHPRPSPPDRGQRVRGRHPDRARRDDGPSCDHRRGRARPIHGREAEPQLCARRRFRAGGGRDEALRSHATWPPPRRLPPSTQWFFALAGLRIRWGDPSPIPGRCRHRLPGGPNPTRRDRRRGRWRESWLPSPLPVIPVEEVAGPGPASWFRRWNRWRRRSCTRSTTSGRWRPDFPETATHVVGPGLGDPHRGPDHASGFSTRRARH